jgi:hypothetical protein
MVFGARTNSSMEKLKLSTMKASGKIIASMGTVFINSLTAATTGEIG